jgi:TonB family protein
MKRLIFCSIILWFLSFSGLSQSNIISSDSLKTITLLKNSTYEIKEFTKDSLLIYKGTLSSINPEVRHGRFYFFDNKGKVIVTGIYKQDIPYGIWVYYNESYDTLKTINYTAVWDYLANEALDYSVDSTVLKKLKKKINEHLNPDGTFKEVDKMPMFNNKQPFTEFKKYLFENMVYPVYAARKEIQDQFDVQFIIDSKGNIKNPVLTSPALSDLSIEAIRMLFESHTWEPGYINNLPVNTIYSWTFNFNSWNMFSLNSSTLKKEGASESFKLNGEDVYITVEEMPIFNGGDPAIEFRKYIFQNLRYPVDAALNGISGRVIIQFIINPEGKLINPDVVVSAGPILDQEAIRLINSSPLWKPGYQRGKPVNVIYTFPLNFVLQ